MRLPQALPYFVSGSSFLAISVGSADSACSKRFFPLDASFSAGFLCCISAAAAPQPARQRAKLFGLAKTQHTHHPARSFRLFSNTKKPMDVPLRYFFGAARKGLGSH